MKTLLFLTLLLPGFAFCLEWEAGVREVFITSKSYSYNSDSSARIYRDLFDKGYRRISLQPRLAYAGDRRSQIYHPQVRSSFDEIVSANVRIRLADGKMTLRPLLYSSPGLGEAKVLTPIQPARAEVALSSYSQVVSQYLVLAGQHHFDRVVVGSGIVHLLENEELIPRFQVMLNSFRSRVGPKVNLVIEAVGERDIKALIQASQRGLNLLGTVDGISVVLTPEEHFINGQIKVPELKRVRMLMDSYFPGLPIHLGRMTIPGCLNFYAEASEYYCHQGAPDLSGQRTRFEVLKQALVQLNDEGISYESVELMETNTDFEPGSADLRFPYFNPSMSSPAIYELPRTPPLVLAPFPLQQRVDKKLACIYYDKNDLTGIDRVGDIHSVMLESNLGAFKSWRTRRLPLAAYTEGQLSECEAVFYLGTNYLQQIPSEFLTELAILSDQIPVVWFNYKLPYLVSALQGQFQDPGFNAEVLIQPDSTPSPTNTNPGFFRFFDYKGETFHKLSEWNPLSNNFAASAELHRITLKEDVLVDVLAHARHSHTNHKTPYAVRSGNIWYFADSPFSFVHYEDRYFIFADLLWDIMGEEAPTEKVALVRIEDVAPNTNMEGLRWAINYFSQEKVPFSLAVIPYYNDLIGDGSTRNNPVFAPITKYPELTSLLRYAKANGGAMIMHGVGHAVGSLISGYDGITGSDYEFWLYPEDRPLPFDSVDWLTKRLDQGIKVFQDLGLRPAAFEVPHYAASVMNYMVFARMFNWNYHRSIYFPFEVRQDTALPEFLSAFNCDAAECGDERRAILQNIDVMADHEQFAGIPVPYIIWRDAYGQAVIPETLGMVDFAFYDSQTWRPVSKPEDIIRRAKKLRVIRGAMASFFWHPHMLNPNARYYKEVPGSYEKIGGRNSLRLVIQGLKDLGYTFKSIEDQSVFPVEHFQ